MDKLDNLGKKDRGKKMTSEFLPWETENRHECPWMQPKVEEGVSVRKKQSFACNCWVLEDHIAFCPQKIISGCAKWGLNHRGKGNIQVRNLRITEERLCKKN